MVLYSYLIQTWYVKLMVSTDISINGSGVNPQKLSPKTLGTKEILAAPGGTTIAGLYLIFPLPIGYEVVESAGEGICG